LGHALRRLAHEGRGRRRPHLHFTLGGLVAIHRSAPLQASNNVVEYEDLENSLHIAVELCIRRLDVRGDSQLVIGLVLRDSECHEPKMVTYCREVLRLEDKFDGLELNHVFRWDNKAVVALVKMASGRTTVPPGVFATDLFEPTVHYEETHREGKRH
jgi:ribonuclease HI